MTTTDHLEKSRVLIQEGNLAAAELCLMELPEEDRERAVLLGIVYAKTGRFDDAVEHLEAVLEADEDQAEALTWLAAVRRFQHRDEEAIVLLRRLLAFRKEDPEIFNLLGICLIALGKATEAEESLRQAILLQPDMDAAYANLGMALRLENKAEEALEAFQSALRLNDSQAQSYLQVFKQFQQLSRWTEAAEILDQGLKKHPGSAVLTEALALTFARLKRPIEAEKLFKKVAPFNVAAANSFAGWLQEQGRFDEAVPILKGSLSLNPKQGVPYRLLAESHQLLLDGKSYETPVRTLLDDHEVAEVERMHLAYALGELHEQKNDYQAAMTAFDLANEIAYRTYPRCRTFDVDWTRREPELISQLYTSEFFERLEGSSDGRPIFIVGMLRAGTTLLNQIITSHPDVASLGEGPFWNTESYNLNAKWKDVPPTNSELTTIGSRYLEAMNVPDDAPRFADKMPLNYRNLGMIHAVFPKAKIVHIRRDAFDTCLSVYTTFFGGGPNFTYKQENIVEFYRAYLKTMEHWRAVLSPEIFFELDYEALVADPSSVTHSVIEFLDLHWNEACLRPESNKQEVFTPSRWQARQPIYSGSTDKRLRYGPYCGALAEL